MATIYLVACSSQKQDARAAAQDLYTSPLFRKSRALAERDADDWYILSAKFHALDPHTRLAPYDLTLRTMNADQRRHWAYQAFQALLRFNTLNPGDRVVLLAGKLYREHLVPLLEGYGLWVEEPLEHFGIGEQLQYLTMMLTDHTQEGTDHAQI